ncbi:MAG: histidine kinase [Bacteroidales bacterium]
MKINHSVLLHIGLWVLISIPTLVFFLFFDQHIPPQRLWFTGISFLFTLINFYFFYSFLIPYLYFRQKRVFLLLIVTFIFILLFPFLQHKIFSVMMEAFEWNFRKVRHPRWFFPESYTVTMLYTGLAFLARFTTRWIVDQQIKAELINRNQASELALLRSQVNPHFLFNTLNNIYSLVYTKSDLAPGAMTKLSDILRYMLYEANTDRVALSKEAGYLESYIELLQLRLSDKNFIRFEVAGTTDDKLIAPMMLLPFVENAYKHCNKKSESPGIRIYLAVKNNVLSFTVINSVKKEIESEEGIKGGIGMKNMQRRLELLYPGKHALMVAEDNLFYTVELTIELK